MFAKLIGKVPGSCHKYVKIIGKSYKQLTTCLQMAKLMGTTRKQDSPCRNRFDSSGISTVDKESGGIIRAGVRVNATKTFGVALAASGEDDARYRYK